MDLWQTKVNPLVGSSHNGSPRRTCGKRLIITFRVVHVFILFLFYFENNSFYALYIFIPVSWPCMRLKRGLLQGALNGLASFKPGFSPLFCTI